MMINDEHENDHAQSVTPINPTSARGRPRTPATTSDRGYKTMSKSIPSAANKMKKPLQRKRYRKTGRKR
jgi:hypothetical protein